MKYKQAKRYSLRFSKYLKKSSVTNDGIGVYEIEIVHDSDDSLKEEVEKDYVSLIEELRDIKDYRDLSQASIEGYILEYLTYCHFKSYFNPNKVDKQHWIPVCYLKGFSDQPDISQDLYRLVKISSLESTIELTGLNEDFRTKQTKNNIIYSYDYENFFSVIENEYAAIRNYWVKYFIDGNKVNNGLTKSAPISAYEKIILSIFCASLYMRTKDKITQIQKKSLITNSTELFYRTLLKMSIDFSSKKLSYYFSPNFLFTSQSPVSSTTGNIVGTDWYVPVHTNMALFFVDNEVIAGENNFLNLSKTLQGKMILKSKDSIFPFLYGNPTMPVFNNYKKFFANSSSNEIKNSYSSLNQNYPDI